MTIALRRRLSPETLNTIIDLDLSWLIKDWALGLGSTLEIMMSQITLVQARFPDIGQIAKNEALSEIGTWVVLPYSWAAAQIATGTSIDRKTKLPCGQVNCFISPLSAILKAFHWMRQGYFLQPELNEPFGLLAFHPTLAEASAAAKTRLGRGGQAHWHDTSYIGSSWGTIIGGLDVDSYKLTEDQLNSCMLFQSHWTMGQLCALLSTHCYSGALPRLAVHRHTLVPIWAIAAMPFQVQTLAHNGEEIDEVIDHGDSTPPKTTIDVVVPNNIDVNIKRR